MIQEQSAVFIGKDRSPAFRDFLVEDGFFFVFEAESGLTKANGHKLMKQLEKRKKEHGQILNLQDLEIFVQESLMAEDVPAHFSLAAGVINRGILYIKTIGAGEVHLRRGKDFVRLIHGNKSASGYIEDRDLVVFTTATFRGIIEEEEKLEKPLNKLQAEELVQHLEQFFDQKHDQAAVAIIATMMVVDDPATEQAEEDQAEQMGFAAGAAPPESPAPQKSAPFRSRRRGVEPADDGLSRESDTDTQPESATQKSKRRFPNISLPGGLTKKLTLVAVVVLLAIFIWSIVFGYQRRQQAEIEEQIATAQEQITQQTTEAEEIAFLNLDRALVILNEAKAELEELEANVEDPQYQEQIDELRETIDQVENTIVRKDEQEPDEFFDLALEAEDAKGDDFYRDGERLAILDRDNQTVYNFSLEDKSLEKSSNEVVGDADLVGINDGTIYVFDADEGIYQFTNDEDVEKVVEPADEWGEIVDMGFFLSNIYLLDAGAGEVWKYVPAGSGFSDPSSYFSEETPAGLNDATGLTIDASIYVARSSDVVKYTRGAEDNFETVFPNDQVSIEGIYTDPEIEKVYVWDKQNATVFVLSKNGKYERQVKASVLGQAADITVYDGQILVLSGSTIYALQETDE